MGHLLLASAVSPLSAISPLSKIPSPLSEVWPTSLPLELVSPLPLASCVRLPMLLPLHASVSPICQRKIILLTNRSDVRMIYNFLSAVSGTLLTINNSSISKDSGKMSKTPISGVKLRSHKKKPYQDK